MGIVEELQEKIKKMEKEIAALKEKPISVTPNPNGDVHVYIHNVEPPKYVPCIPNWQKWLNNTFTSNPYSTFGGSTSYVDAHGTSYSVGTRLL